MGCRVIPIDRAPRQTAAPSRAVTEDGTSLIRFAVLVSAVIAPVFLGVALRLDLDALLAAAPKEALILTSVGLYYGLYRILTPGRARAAATRPIDPPSPVSSMPMVPSTLSRVRARVLWAFVALAPAAALAALVSQEAVGRALPLEQVLTALLGYWGLLWALAASKKRAR